MSDLTNYYTWFAVCSLLAFGLVGFIDDYLKLTRNHAKGMIGRIKQVYRDVLEGRQLSQFLEHAGS